MSDDSFLDAVQGVTPLKIEVKVDLRKHTNSAEALAARRAAALIDHKADPNKLSTSHVDMVQPYDIIAWKKHGVQDGVYRKLRLGKYPLEARLDLHRKTVEQARRDVFSFIEDCMRYDLRTVIILHGKADKKDNPALLKSWLNQWLPEFDEVLAFHSAQPAHGGTGAVYVLLRKSENKKQETREKHGLKGAIFSER
jgi:DNA-nicking Smr family endonuclease